MEACLKIVRLMFYSYLAFVLRSFLFFFCFAYVSMNRAMSVREKKGKVICDLFALHSAIAHRQSFFHSKNFNCICWKL